MKMVENWGVLTRQIYPPPYEKIRCNHYVTKSFDEYMSRGNPVNKHARRSARYLLSML